MKKVFIAIILLQSFAVPTVYGQKSVITQTPEKAAFLAKAPARVQQYYRVFDSLAATPQEKPAHQKWSINELKKYAGMVNDAYEYDPIRREINYKSNLIKSRSLQNKYVTDDIDVIQEVEKRISKKHAALIKSPYWLTISVVDIVKSPYTLEDDPNTTFEETTVFGKITKIWKGNKFKNGEIVSGYYYDFWNYSGLIKGNTYLIALYPIMKNNNPTDIKYALGCPDQVQQSIFPVENGYVIDEDNLFKMGTRIEIGKFTEALSSTINQIRSWGDTKSLEERQ